MEKLCPNCGFEVSESTPVCPNCGYKWVKKEMPTSNAPYSDTDQSNDNDDIRWSEYKHVSIGEMEEQFSDTHRDQEESNSPSSRVTGFQPTEKDDADLSDTPFFSHKQIDQDHSEAKQTATEDEQMTTHDAEILSAYIRHHKGEEDELESAETEIANTDTDKTEEHADHVTGSDERAVKDDQEGTDQSIAAEKTNTPLSEKPVAIDQPLPTTEDNHSHKAKRTSDRPKKQTKKIIYLAAAACIVAVGGGWMYYQQQQTAAQEAKIAQETADLDQIEAALNAMYTNQTHVYLNNDVTEASVETLRERLSAFKDNDRYQNLAAEADTLSEKIAALTEINGYFSEPAVVKDQLNQVSLKEASAISMSKRNEADGFDKLVNQAITMGQTEYQQIQEVQNAVKSMTALIKDGKAPDSVTRVNYNALLKKVQALPIAAEVTDLTESLQTVETSLTKREADEKVAAEKAAAEKAAAEKAAAETAAAEEAAAKAAQSASNSTTQTASEGSYVLSPDTPTNTNNQPIIPARQSDLADTSNTAWNWADGVKEKIIATAIARGYVVEGGYSFERVRIVDGEGYYNFYATNAKGNLLKGTGDAAFPMYLFTVNAKTGYFKGNGNDHTVR